MEFVKPVDLFGNPKRRMSLCVILLFCCSLGMAQYKLDRALFRGSESQNGTLTNSQTLDAMPRGAWLMEDMMGADTGKVSKDSLGFQAGKVRYATEESGKSTTLAMLLSAALPGAGQVYVHRYITIPIIWGFGYAFVRSWIRQNDLYVQYRDKYTASFKADSTGKGDDFLRVVRDFYRDDRDKFSFYIAIVYVLNIVDAYVGASLYSFDVSDNLGGSAAIRFRIPLH